MTENTVLCCGKPVKKEFSRDDNLYTVKCLSCGKWAGQVTMPAAMEAFKQLGKGEKTSTAPPKNTPETQAQPPRQQAQTKALVLSRDTFAESMVSRMTELSRLTVPFVGRNRDALERLVANNLRYVLTNKNEKFMKVWHTQEGVESIAHGVEEALSLGAELGKMGSLVPYGTVVEFIPAIEAFEFALTAGPEPPFSGITIELIHEHDIIKELYRDHGEYHCKVEHTLPRGKVIGVAVYGYNNRLGMVIGEDYDAERLLKKAERHSPGYKSYKRQVDAFEYARTEQRVHTDAEGREYAMVEFVSNTEDPYFEQNAERFREAEKENKLKTDSKGEYAHVEIPKRDGGTFKKKIYRSIVENGTEIRHMYIDDLTNPYEGPDQAEMLRKTAGKSFLGKYAKVRNSEAAMDEVKKGDADAAEEMADRLIAVAFENMDAGSGSPRETEAETVEAEDDGVRWESYEIGPEPDISDELEAMDSSKGNGKEKAAEADAEKGEQGELGI